MSQQHAHSRARACKRRVAHRDITLDGLSIRKGQQVWVPFYALHNSPINFTQPATFDPERWRHEAESEGKEGAAHAEATASSSKEAAARCSGNPLHAHATPSGHALAKSKAWSFMPFGEGPRGCIGKTLALADARTILLVSLGTVRACASLARPVAPWDHVTRHMPWPAPPAPQSILSRFFIELDPSVGDHAEVEAGEVRVPAWAWSTAGGTRAVPSVQCGAAGGVAGAGRAPHGSRAHAAAAHAHAVRGPRAEQRQAHQAAPAPPCLSPFEGARSTGRWGSQRTGRNNAAQLWEELGW